MPIYEYVCRQCKHELEILQGINEGPLTKCPTCNQNSLEKLISAAGFRLAGSGWYETDFKTSNQRHLAESKKSEKDDGAKSATQGADKSAGSDKGGDKSDSSKPKAAEKKDGTAKTAPARTQ